VFTRGKDSSLFAECLQSAKILQISHFNLFFRFHPHIYIYIRKILYHHKDHQYHIYITNITSILQTQLIHIHIPNRFTHVLLLQIINMHVSQYKSIDV
jgi:hypothetical protein